MEELRLRIIDLCNQSGISVEAMLFVIRDIYRDVQSLYDQYRMQQQQQANKAAAEAPIIDEVKEEKQDA